MPPGSPRRVVSERTLREALGALGLLRPAPWPEIRKAYLEAVRTTHPDVTGDQARGAETARIVDAYRFLRTVTDGGTKDLVAIWDATIAPGMRPSAVGGPPVLRIDVPNGDTFGAVHEMMGRIYPITGVDRSAGMILAMVHDPSFASSQLTAEVVPTGAGTAEVTFTLESLGPGPPPPMATVLRNLTRGVFR